MPVQPLVEAAREMRLREEAEAGQRAAATGPAPVAMDGMSPAALARVEQIAASGRWVPDFFSLPSSSAPMRPPR